MLIKKRPADEIEILGHRYSPALRTLYERVRALHQKPIKVIELNGDVDNTINTLGEEIVLRLHRGSTEDNIAHELMHAVMRAEGYPDFVPIESPYAKVMLEFSGDLDHIIINDRLLELGYDAQEGFLKEADGYNGVLRMHGYESPDKQAMLQFAILHQLIKFHYYIGVSSAQADILERFPEAAKYWQKLLFSIDSLPPKPKPKDMWNVGAEYITLGDVICADLGASIRISNLIILEPLPLRRNQLSKAAKSIFAQSTQGIETDQDGHEWILLRTFLINPRIMVSAYLTWADSTRVEEINQLSVREFLQQRNIRYILVD